MQKNNPDSELWNFIEIHENGAVKLPDEIFQNFVNLFKKHFPKKAILFDFV